MRKRILAVLLFTLVFITAACNSQAPAAEPQAENSAAPVAAEAEPQAEASDEESKLVLAYVSYTVPPDLQIVEDKLSELTREKIGASVELMVYDYSSYEQQLNLMMSGSNEQLDLVLMSPTFDVFLTRAQNNQLQPIDGLLEEYAPETLEMLGDTAYLAKWNGQMLGVPKSNMLTFGTALCIRRDIAEGAGINLDEIKNLDDVEEKVLPKLLEAYPDIPPMCTPQVGMPVMEIQSFYYDTLGDSLGVISDMNSTKVVNRYAENGYKDVLDRVRRWYEAGYIMPDVVTSTEDHFALLGADRAWCYMSIWGPSQEMNETKNVGKPVAVIRMDNEAIATTSMSLGSVYGVPINCKQPAKAIELLNLLYTDTEVSTLINYGIEGTHYEVKADGSIGYPEGVDANNCGYVVGSNPGNMYIPGAYRWEGTPADEAAQIEAFNESVVLSPAIGFVFNTTPVKTEIAACNNVVSKYRISLESGAVDPAAMLPEFTAELTEAGIDTIVAEKQKQLDEWLAANE